MPDLRLIRADLLKQPLLPKAPVTDLSPLTDCTTLEEIIRETILEA